MKEIDLNTKVIELAQDDKLRNILIDLGFKDLNNKAKLQMMGRVMTIPKACKVKGIDLEHVKEVLAENGYKVVDQDRTAQIRSYIERLNKGEDLESVRADFVKDFKNVDAKEIMDVEQILIKEGMSVKEATKLCDVHSALFHGMTEQEVLEKEGANLPMGHPLSIMKLENKMIAKKADILKKAIEDHNLDEVRRRLVELKDIRYHYSKKEELIFPFLEHYGITGPGEVMWGVDDEIRQKISYYAKNVENEEKLDLHKEGMLQTIERLKEMIFKEEEILFPLALENFTKEEWYKIYRDLDEMGYSYLDSGFAWKEADDYFSNQAAEKVEDGMVHLDTGYLSVKQLMAIFNLLPVDLTFIDENEIVHFFTVNHHIFSRPLSCIGRSVYECHPPRIKPVVETMIDDFKHHRRSSMEIWMKKPDHPTLIRYVAVYDDNDDYIGTLEIAQDYGEALKSYKEQ